ncbi:MAG: AraC family transcriptional regulator [Bacteroidetes bacterium]|nr:AraC family transcriptional regulator [Bacteroidota bacterium]
MVKRQKFSVSENGEKWIGYLQRVYFSKTFTAKNFNTIQFAKINELPSGNLILQLKENLGLSFIQCKIVLRIYYAIHCINEGYLKLHTVEGLANECGFNSRSRFSVVFKAVTHYTPKEYAEKTRQTLPNWKELIAKCQALSV